jgi:hypothetical protein
MEDGLHFRGKKCTPEEEIKIAFYNVMGGQPAEVWKMAFTSVEKNVSTTEYSNEILSFMRRMKFYLSCVE